jgi:hypothetical protein
VDELERQGVNILTKIEQLDLNQSLRYRSKVKDDEIAQLSVQLWHYLEGYNTVNESDKYPFFILFSYWK